MTAISAHMAALMMGNAELVSQGLAQPLSPDGAREQAIRAVRKNLPIERRAFRWWLKRPTKNADLAYRKN